MKDYSLYPQLESQRLHRLEAQIEEAKIRRLQRRVELALNIITATLWALMIAALWRCFAA